MVQSHAFQDEIQALRNAEFVEYERVHELKLRVLEAPVRQFQDRVGTRHAALPRFARLHRTRRRIAAPLRGSLGARRRNSPPKSRYLDLARLAGGVSRTRRRRQRANSPKKHWRSVLFYKYMQWQLDLQLASRPGTCPRARAQHRTVSRPGASHRSLRRRPLGAPRLFRRQAAASARRPDDLLAKGQDWAFPPPNSERHYQDGYRLFAESIRKNCGTAERCASIT